MKIMAGILILVITIVVFLILRAEIKSRQPKELSDASCK